MDGVDVMDAMDFMDGHGLVEAAPPSTPSTIGAKKKPGVGRAFR